MNRKPGKEIPALYGGIIIALILNIPGINLLNYCMCCGGIMLGGFFAVMFYKNNFTPETPPLESNDCLIVGALSGFVGAAIGTVLWAIILAIFGNYIVDFVLRFIDKMGTQGLPQYYLDLLNQASQAKYMKLTPLGFILELLKNIIIDIIFGGLGGLIAYQLFKPKYPYYQPPVQPPAPPSM